MKQMKTNSQQSLVKKIDKIGHLVHPHLLYPDNSPDLSSYISTISPKQAILLKTSAAEEPSVVAGLSLSNVVHIFLEDILEKKVALIEFFSNPTKVNLAQDLAMKAKTSEDFNKVKNYIRNHAKYFN